MAAEYYTPPNGDETKEKTNQENEQEQIAGPEVSDWEPSAPPDDGSPPDYYTAIWMTEPLTDVPAPPEYITPPVQGLQMFYSFSHLIHYRSYKTWKAKGEYHSHDILVKIWT